MKDTTTSFQRQVDASLSGDSISDEDVLIAAWCSAIESLARQSACCSPVQAGLPSYFGGRGRLAALAAPAGDPGIEPQSSAKVSMPSGRFVLPRVHVINPGRLAQIADIWLDGGRIVALQAPGSAVAQGYEILHHFAGRWVMPGLIDMHAHLPADNVLKLTPHFMCMFLAHGVTGIREAGDIDGTALVAARAWQLRMGNKTPRIAAANFFVGRPPFRWKNSLAYDTPEDAPRIIARLVAAGARCIKLYENLRAEDIAVLQRHAEQAGLVVMGHVPAALTLEEAGIRDAQHFFGVAPPASLRRGYVFNRAADWHAVDPQRLDAVASHCERYGLANTPTLALSQGLLGYRNFPATQRLVQGRMPSFFGDVIWHPAIGIPAYRGLVSRDFDALEDAFEKKKRLVRELASRGCTLFPGTDTMQPFCIPGWSLHRELGLFVDAGLTPTAALKTATVDAATRLGWDDAGRVDAGCRADLVILSQDPTVSLSALESIQQVVVQGVVHDVAALRGEINADLQSRESVFQRIASKVLARLAMRRAARHFVG